MASGGADGFVCLWDAAAGTLLRRCGVEGPVAALAALAGDAGVAASRSDVAEFRLLSVPDLAVTRRGTFNYRLPGAVTGLCGLPDGRLAIGVRGWGGGARGRRWKVEKALFAPLPPPKTRLTAPMPTPPPPRAQSDQLVRVYGCP